MSAEETKDVYNLLRSSNVTDLYNIHSENEELKNDNRIL